MVALLDTDSGATMPELIAATGWLPHTTRATLTGPGKPGHAGCLRGYKDPISVVQAALPAIRNWTFVHLGYAAP